jgi:hypothetical protein
MNYIYAIIVFIILGICGYGYKLYQDNIILKNNQVILEKSINEQYDVILKNKQDFTEITEINNNLKLLTESQEKRYTDLQNVFEKEKTKTVIIDNKEQKRTVKRDIGKLALEKPKLVQNAINTGTIKAFDCFSIITNQNFKGDINECK